MREAGVNLVSVGIFSWALLETSEGVFDFAWLDELLDLLHENGIAVDLGTPTASPPAWFFADHPDARVVTRDGTVMGFGSRGMASHSSPAYREAVVRIASALAERYGEHPAVVLWHVHNEYGVPVGEDYSEQSVAAFREWLQDALRHPRRAQRARGAPPSGVSATATGTTSARPRPRPPSSTPPSGSTSRASPTHQLRECFIAERDAIRAHAIAAHHDQLHGEPELDDRPVGVGARGRHRLERPLPVGRRPRGRDRPRASRPTSRARSAGGKPWILMEHSTSAVNWQPRNVAKRPGEMARNSLSHVGRGADAILFFQWRASRSGAEKFHSAMLPHAGTDSRVWREVVELGAALGRLDETARLARRRPTSRSCGTSSRSGRRTSSGARPRTSRTPSASARSTSGCGATASRSTSPCPGSDLSGYSLVVAPAQYLLSARGRREPHPLRRAAAARSLVSFFSAIVDENDAVHAGGFGAPLRDALGVTRRGVPAAARGRRRATVDWVRRCAADAHARRRGRRTSSSTAPRSSATYVDGPGAGSPRSPATAHGDGHGLVRQHAAGRRRASRTLHARACTPTPGVAPSGLPGGRRGRHAPRRRRRLRRRDQPPRRRP